MNDTSDKDKDFSVNDSKSGDNSTSELESILAQFVDENGLYKTCGQDHSIIVVSLEGGRFITTTSPAHTAFNKNKKKTGSKKLLPNIFWQEEEQVEE
jgi:hypothetical protein